MFSRHSFVTPSTTKRLQAGSTLNGTNLLQMKLLFMPRHEVGKDI